MSGAPYSGGGSLYHVASTDANVIAPGDPVIVTGTADTRGIPTVTRATAAATNRITGVMMSRIKGETTVLHDDTLNTTASTSQYILVEDNPNVVYEAQCSAGLAVGDISNTADLLIPASTTDGKSGAEVDSTSFAAGATGQVRVLRVVRRPNNDVGANANVEIVINLPTTANDRAGI